METQEITRGEWQRFLDDFSKQHQGARATLQVIGDDVGVQTEAQSLPFVGISSEEGGSAKGAITVMLGTEAEDHIQHQINDPNHLWQRATGDHAKDALEIEAADGTKTILQLEPVPQLQ
ncbi:MAG: hypothetical protein JWN14_3060 [Chthonomonadales bacterium]|nr:hypothetical protein [Chthonomonadales bacterium]